MRVGSDSGFEWEKGRNLTKKTKSVVKEGNK